ncbi:MAG TPA: RNA methyltransferase [Solirubrobacteraceae bacterium]
MTITSQHNPALKHLRRLARKTERERSGRFAVEGEDLIAAAERAGSRAIEGFRVTGSGLGGEGFVDVDERALASVSTLGSGTRAIGVYEQCWAERPRGPLCVYLHGVGDPGNVGTVLRSARAFGASGVALGPGCADPYGPKAVRASMGAIFEVEIARVESVAQLPGERVALVADPSPPAQPLHKLDGPVTLLIGAEREGLPPDVVGACERTAHIPIEAESLNAAMAATVALYEMTRQANRVAAK